MLCDETGLPRLIYYSFFFRFLLHFFLLLAHCDHIAGVVYNFQENLLRTMIQIENTYFELGESCKKNCLIICDRGVMDASACK